MANKPERHEQEKTIHGLRHEGGIQAARDWLYGQRDEVNRKWPDAVGEDRGRLQGEAKQIARLIKVIDQGPAIKVIDQGPAIKVQEV